MPEKFFYEIEVNLSDKATLEEIQILIKRIEEITENHSALRIKIVPAAEISRS